MIKQNRFLKESIKAYLGNEDKTSLKKAAIKLTPVQMVEITNAHSMGGLMHHLSITGAFDTCSLDGSITESWKKSSWDKSLSNTINDTEAARLAAIFDDNSIPYAYIKGAVCRKYYPEDYIRSSIDIDFFIPREAYDDIKKALISDGYHIPEDHYAKTGITMDFTEYEKIANEMMFIKKGVVTYTVDVQWDMLTFNPNSIFGQLYDINNLILNNITDTFEVECHPMRTLPTENELLVMVFHFTFHHGFRGLKWLIDIFTFIKNCGLSPDELVKGMTEDNRKLIGIMYSIACDYTDLPKLTKNQKKTLCLDRLAPLEIPFYKGIVYKTNMGVMQSIEHRIVKMTLPYRFVSRMKAFVYIMFNPASIDHRLSGENQKPGWTQPFRLIKIAVGDFFRNRNRK